MFYVDSVLDQCDRCCRGDGWADLVCQARFTAREGFAAYHDEVVWAILDSFVDVFYNISGVEVYTAKSDAVHMEALSFHVCVV